MTMATHEIALVPREGFFVKDGRGWYTSASGRGHSLDWPFPSTVLGALRTALGRSLERAAGGARFDGAAFRRETEGVALGPVLPLRRPVGCSGWAREHRMWPVPADALHLRGEKEVIALRPEQPTEPTLGRDDDAAREALWRPRVRLGDKPEEPPRFWTEGDFTAWLGEARIHKPSREEKAGLELSRRVDIHVGIDPKTQATSDGMFFASDTIEPLSKGGSRPWEWAIGLSGTMPVAAGIDASPWTLGGDRRIARPESAAGVFELPAPAPFVGETRGLRVVVITPALFMQGWLPDDFSARDGEYRGEMAGIKGELVLRAALVPRAVHVSGWDMAAGQPKPTLRLVPPGAVYFLQKKASGASFSADEVRSLWFATLGGRTSEGMGYIVAGRWTPAAT